MSSNAPDSAGPDHLDSHAARRFEGIVDSAPDAIIGIDPSGRITLFNPSAQRIFGYHREEVIGRNVAFLMPSPYREEHDGYLRKYHHTGVPGAIGRVRKVHGRRRNGDIFPIELAVSESRVGNDRSYAAIIRDVSERAAAEEAIRLSEARFEAFTTHAPTLAFLRDSQSRHLYVNRMFERFFRIHARDIVGRSADDALPSTFVHAMRASDEIVIGNRQPLELLQHLRGPDGAMHDWLFVRFPVEISPGCIAIGGVGIEVTTRRRAERRLRLQLDLVRAMARSDSIGSETSGILRTIAEGLAFELAEYWTIDRADDALELSAVWSAPGCEFESFMAAGLTRRIAFGTGLPGAAAAQRRVVASLDVMNDPHLVPDAEAGPSILRHAHAIPVAVGSELLGVIALYRRDKIDDDDEEFRSLLESVGAQLGEHEKFENAKRSVVELRQAAEQRSRLTDMGAVAARIVHDLGNPLAGMKLNAQLLVRATERAPNETVREAAQGVLDSLHHLIAMLGDLKDFARSQRLDLKSVDAVSLVRDVAQPWSSVADTQGIRLAIDATEPAFLEVDPDRMRRVLDNLIKNAVEATPAGGIVNVNVHFLGDHVRISIEDTGCGVPDGVDVFRLFETTKPNGSGLGLSIAREIVEAHRGTLRFERRTPLGTAFHLDLPRSVPLASIRIAESIR